jgi:hypothetical protein
MAALDTKLGYTDAAVLRDFADRCFSNFDFIKHFTGT